MGLRKKIKRFLYIRKFKQKNYSINVNKKNILITGANSGIGLALTKKLLTLENKVIATYRQKSDNLEKIFNKNLFNIKCDQREIKDFAYLEEKLKEFPIDVIFNCAGVFGPSFEDQEIERIIFEKFNEVLMVNSLSIIRIIQIILKNKLENKLPELLVNISSDAGSISENNQGNAYIYRTSKTALNSITKNMSLDLYKKYKTIVFAIDPGNVQTNMNPGGLIKAEVCANLILNLISSDVEKLNGRFVNLNGKEISW